MKSLILGLIEMEKIKFINKNIFRNDQEKYSLDQVQQTDQNMENNFKKMKKLLNVITITTIINTLDKKIFSVRQGSISTKNIASLTTVSVFTVAEVNSIKKAILSLSEKSTAQIKLKKLINIISLRGYMCVLASNITKKIANSCSIVISSVATRDIHNFVGISSGLSVLNLRSEII